MKQVTVLLGLVLLAGPLVRGNDLDAMLPLLDDLELQPEPAPRSWRSLAAVAPRKFYGCSLLGPGESYAGAGARITTVELASVNTTDPALQTCCKLCYFVKDCRKFTFRKKIDGIDPGQVWAANCTLFRKAAKKLPAPVLSQYIIAGGVVNLDPPPPMG